MNENGQKGRIEGVETASIRDFCAWLENFLDYERIKKKEEFSLETMLFLADRFNHPERSFRSIHVAGSKGKGSVSAMLSSIIEAAGTECGLYTSPHLESFTERVGLAHGPFDEAIYAKAAKRVMPLVDSILPVNIPGGNEPSWFELVTLFAFCAFETAKLDWAVVETGLGGRLDATNILKSSAAVITTIELEHTEYLGNTLSKIAGEKAGIIKEGIPVFLSAQNAESRGVITRKAAQLNAPLFYVPDYLETCASKISVLGNDITLSFRAASQPVRFNRPIKARLKLLNTVQAENAALAAFVAKYLFPDISEDTIERGLEAAWLPCRSEIFSTEPIGIIDGAHTVKSVSLSLETFFALLPSAHPMPILLFACASDKDVSSIAPLCTGKFSSIIVTRPGERKQSDMEKAREAFELAASRSDGTVVTADGDYERAISNALRMSEADQKPLLITGSFYLAHEAKKILRDQNRDRKI